MFTTKLISRSFRPAQPIVLRHYFPDLSPTRDQSPCVDNVIGTCPSQFDDIACRIQEIGTDFEEKDDHVASTSEPDFSSLTNQEVDTIVFHMRNLAEQSDYFKESKESREAIIVEYDALIYEFEENFWNLHAKVKLLEKSNWEKQQILEKAVETLKISVDRLEHARELLLDKHLEIHELKVIIEEQRCRIVDLEEDN